MNMSKILVYTSEQESGLSSNALEALGFGQRISKATKKPVEAVVIGSNVKSVAEEAILCGASTVYQVENPLLANYQADLYFESLLAAFEKSAADIFVIPF